MNHKQSSSFPMGQKIRPGQKHNTQNNLWLAHGSNDTPRAMQTKYSQNMMVFGCVTCVGDVMPPHFFREGPMLSLDDFVELLVTILKPRITRVSKCRPYVWQHDSAPCHTSGNSHKWL